MMDLPADDIVLHAASYGRVGLNSEPCVIQVAESLLLRGFLSLTIDLKGDASGYRLTESGRAQIAKAEG